MSFLLFLTLVAILYVIWLRNKPKVGIDQYQKGFEDGKKLIINIIENLPDNERVDKQYLLNELEKTEPRVTSTSANILVGSATSHLASSTNTKSYGTDYVSVKQLTSEEQESRNQNIMLFVGSLLFVAAAAAFVSGAMSDITKLVGIWMAVIGFYIIGMILHENSKLRPAAIAFIGTSLGALPFAGVALYQMTDLSATHSWLITSIIGVVAYFYAAIRLQSQVVSYLTLAFVVSLVAAFGDSLSESLVWSYTLIIVLALAINLIAAVKPSWLPAVFSKPIHDTGNYLTPLTLLASLFMIDRFELIHYEILLGLATIQYLVLWLQAKRYEYEVIIRILLQIFVLVLAWDITKGGINYGWVILVSAFIQQIYTLLSYSNRQKDQVSTEIIWYHVMQLFQVGAIAVWSNLYWSSELTAIALFVIGLSSLLLVIQSRQISTAVSGLLASLLLPVTIARDIITPAWEWAWIAAIYLGMSVLIVLAWEHYIKPRSVAIRQFMLITFCSYSTLAIIMSLFNNSIESVVVLTLVAMILWRASYICRQPLISLFGNIAIGLGFIHLWTNQNYDSTWLMLALAGFMSALLYPTYQWLLHKDDIKRAEYALYTIWVILVIAIAASFTHPDTKMIAAIASIFLAGTVAYDGVRRKNTNLQELGFYIANLGLMRIFGIFFPELNFVFYAHWLALAVSLMAWWQSKNQLFGRERLYLAMGLVTLSTGVFALAEGGWYQILFLVEHITLLIVGALLKKNWAMSWGLIASCLAVLYFLRDVAFLSFAFLGLVVVGVVIWQLSKKQSQSN